MGKKAEIDKVMSELKTHLWGWDRNEISPLPPFFPAEDYHQNYFKEKPGRNPICRIVIAPWVDKLRRDYTAYLKRRLINDTAQYRQFIHPIATGRPGHYQQGTSGTCMPHTHLLIPCIFQTWAYSCQPEAATLIGLTSADIKSLFLRNLQWAKDLSQYKPCHGLCRSSVR